MNSLLGAFGQVSAYSDIRYARGSQRQHMDLVELDLNEVGPRRPDVLISAF
jgi:hypothetical protein